MSDEDERYYAEMEARETMRALDKLVNGEDEPPSSQIKCPPLWSND